MRFSIGVGVGPLRATQNIGMPQTGGSEFNPVKGIWLIATHPTGQDIALFWGAVVGFTWLLGPWGIAVGVAAWLVILTVERAAIDRAVERRERGTPDESNISFAEATRRVRQAAIERGEDLTLRPPLCRCGNRYCGECACLLHSDPCTHGGAS